MVKVVKSLSTVARCAPYLTTNKTYRPGLPSQATLKESESFSSEKDELKYLYRKLSDIIPTTQQKPTSNIEIVLGAVQYIRHLHAELEKEAGNKEVSKTTDESMKRSPLTSVVDNIPQDANSS
ncbi:uncharacterized protein LOC143450685 [Clavelina lepadiformis]|uniref:BHLH domain-containing protein n=1 Tax=Clavelina lepadiformis TaxID=159417 RepID=A0ABP0GK20_CLALP